MPDLTDGEALVAAIKRMRQAVLDADRGLTGEALARARWEQKTLAAHPNFQSWELDILWHGAMQDYPPVVLQAQLVATAAWRRGA